MSEKEQIDVLADYILANRSFEIGSEGAGDCVAGLLNQLARDITRAIYELAIEVLSEALRQRRRDG